MSTVGKQLFRKFHMDLKALIEKLAGKQRKDGKSHSIYLSESIYEKFQKACDSIEIKPSRVLEEFMETFTEEVKSYMKKA